MTIRNIGLTMGISEAIASTADNNIETFVIWEQIEGDERHRIVCDVWEYGGDPTDLIPTFGDGDAAIDLRPHGGRCHTFQYRREEILDPDDPDDVDLLECDEAMCPCDLVIEVPVDMRAEADAAANAWLQARDAASLAAGGQGARDTGDRLTCETVEPWSIRLLDDGVRPRDARVFEHRPMIGLCAWSTNHCPLSGNPPGVLSFPECVAVCGLVLSGRDARFAAAMASLDIIGAVPITGGEEPRWKDNLCWVVNTLSLSDGTRWMVCADFDIQAFEPDDPMIDNYHVLALDADGVPLGFDVKTSVSALVKVEPWTPNAEGAV